MRRIGPLLSVSLLSLACANEHPSVPATREIPIVNGTRELGEDAVVLVQGVIGTCTGTVITDRVILTAKHCVQTRGADAPAPPSFFVVGVGSSARDTVSHRVREIVTTPGAFTGSAITDGSDVALMILRDPIEGVTPIAVRREPPTDLVGREVTAIGFGTTPAGEVGIKYRTTTRIDGTTSAIVYGSMAICQGDSGGPLILESDGTTPRQIVGVASYGQSMIGGPTCPAVLDAWNRVDIQIDLVDRAILRSGGCVVRGEETCNSLDDDCNGTVDDGCAELGEPCETDADCRYAALPEALAEGAPPAVVCADVGGTRACALPCDALEPAGGCTTIDVAFRPDDVAIDGFYCARTDGCAGLCVRGAAGAGANGAPCAAHTDCASLFCTELGVCATPCLGGVAACPSDEVCTADALQCGFCASPSARPSGRALGEPCDDAAQCASLGCGVIDGVSICTAACETDLGCGDGMHCQDGFCARGERAQPFQTCTGDSDCTSLALCLERDGRRFCAARCGGAGSCSGECVEHEGEMRCVPTAPLLDAPCDGSVACAQGECVEGTCTARCGGDELCPIGYQCVREGGETLCRPRPAASGCSVDRGPATPVGPWLAISLAIVSATSRRSRRPRRRAFGTSSRLRRGASRPRARSTARTIRAPRCNARDAGSGTRRA